MQSSPLVDNSNGLLYLWKVRTVSIIKTLNEEEIMEALFIIGLRER